MHESVRHESQVRVKSKLVKTIKKHAEKAEHPKPFGVGCLGCSIIELSVDFRIYDEVMTTNSANARFFALIPCAGQGSRAGAALAKQYQVIAGQPMVLHTLAAFSAVTRLSRTLVVVAPGEQFFDQVPEKPFDVAACGGASRADSVRNGLAALVKSGAGALDWVLVHDAARCLVTAAQIRQLIDACEHDEVGGLLAHKLPDTLKREAGGRVAATLDRSDKWLAQTPQMFRIGTLMRALEAVGGAVTDESSAIEALGLAPKLVPGSAQNFKVTYPEDFALAEAILLDRGRAG
jgi:2-C-methyl-D-erythritol 4-phosphate cytidylyltransferase